MRDRDRQKRKCSSLRSRGKKNRQKEGLPPQKKLEIYRKEYYKMMKKEHAAHGADVGLPGQDYRYMDNLKQKIRKLEKELNVEKPEPVIVPMPSEARIKAIKAKLRRCGYNLAEESASYEVREVQTIDPENYTCPYKKFDPRAHKNAMIYDSDKDTYVLVKPSDFRY